MFSVIASSDLSERGNLRLGLLPLLSQGQACVAPRNDKEESLSALR